MTGMSISDSTGRVSTCARAPLQSCTLPLTDIGLCTAVYMLSAKGVDTLFLWMERRKQNGRGIPGVMEGW